MNSEELLIKLNQEAEMNPDTHDGSYELMRSIIESYSTIRDYSAINFKDLNAIYAMAIGTFKLNVEKKKDYVKDSHLPDSEKARMINIIDGVWDNACLSKYENREENRPTVGMFGTGFYSFEKNADPHSCQRFIQMMVDISGMSDDETIFDRAEKIFDNNFKGMQAAAASVMLHCLKPFTFPILNTNYGSGTIYARLGINLVQPNRLITYIENCRRIKTFRDNSIIPKNYRVMDCFAQKLGKEDSIVYFPTLEEYDPGISKEQYLVYLQNPNIINKFLLDTVYFIYLMNGEATCTGIAYKYGDTPQHYSAHATNMAKAIQNISHCELSTREDGSDHYWSILFLGRYLDATHFSWKLRDPLFEAIEELDENGFFDFLSTEKVEEEKTDFNLNTILYGPPGTGKTYNTVIYAVSIIEKKSVQDVQKEAVNDYKAVKARFEEYKNQRKIAFTTFHQSYGYEEFIEGIKPVMSNSDSKIAYSIEDGVFKAFCKEAAKSDSPNKDNYVFIIDEINRGNISKIFGELITLVEETKRIGANEELKVELPYSHQFFGVPNNVFILGTMNTADRSIAIMDTALRRRFSFIEMLPDTDVLRTFNPVVSSGGTKVNVADMLDVINDRITYLYDREHTIGHAFFMPLKEDLSVETLAMIFEKNIIPLLQEYFYEDYEKIQRVLGDDGKIGDKKQYQFISDDEMNPYELFATVPEMESSKKYTINFSAFHKIESYKLISKKL